MFTKIINQMRVHINYNPTVQPVESPPVGRLKACRHLCIDFNSFIPSMTSTTKLTNVITVNLHHKIVKEVVCFCFSCAEKHQVPNVSCSWKHVCVFVINPSFTFFFCLSGPFVFLNRKTFLMFHRPSPPSPPLLSHPSSLPRP